MNSCLHEFELLDFRSNEIQINVLLILQHKYGYVQICQVWLIKRRRQLIPIYLMFYGISVK